MPKHFLTTKQRQDIFLTTKQCQGIFWQLGKAKAIIVTLLTCLTLRVVVFLVLNRCFRRGDGVRGGGGGDFRSCHFTKTNTCIWSIGLRRVLIPRGDFFDPAILTHFMAKNCPKSAINGTPSHKHAWRLQNGGSVRIKVGSRQDTSGGMCWDHFPGPKWPSGGAIGPQNGSMHQWSLGQE